MSAVLALPPIRTSGKAATFATSAAIHALLLLTFLALTQAGRVVQELPQPAPDPTVWILPHAPSGGGGTSKPTPKQPRKPPKPTPEPPRQVEPLVAAAATVATTTGDEPASDAAPGGDAPGTGEPGTPGPGGSNGDGTSNGTGPVDDSGSEPIYITSEVTPPDLLQRVEPDYPPVARRHRVEGKVVLRCVIGTDGSVSVDEVKFGDKRLVEAARNAVTQWRYSPASFQGQPVAVYLMVTVEFTLD